MCRGLQTSAGMMDIAVCRWFRIWRNIKVESLVIVTLNSDDPAYFGGYVGQNYSELATALQLSEHELQQLAQNSLAAKFI